MMTSLFKLSDRLTQDFLTSLACADDTVACNGSY